MPPSLAWIPSFCHSLSGALDASVSAKINPTVNPLLYKIQIQFGQPLSGSSKVLIWNLFQIFAAKNDVVPQGKLDTSPTLIEVQVILKQRLGFPKNRHPLDPGDSYDK